MASSNPTIEDMSWQSGLSASECHAYMFDQSLLTDVSFVVTYKPDMEEKDESGAEEPVTFQAHKYVLVSRSPVFWAMFHGKMSEKTDEIAITDVDPTAFHQVLRYLYTDTIELDVDTVMFTLYIAKKYMITTLTDKCTEFLKHQITADNAALLLEQCLFFDQKELVKMCKRTIARETSAALQSPTFCDIRQSTLDEILRIEQITAKEIDVFKACEVWATRRCDIQSLEHTSQNLRKVLSDSLHAIHFPAIPVDVFGAVVSKTDILPPEHELQLFRYMSHEGADKPTSLSYPYEDRYVEPSKSLAIPTRLQMNSNQENITDKTISFTLHVEVSDDINITGLIICDLDNKHENYLPQGQNCLAVSVDINHVNCVKSEIQRMDNPTSPNVKYIAFTSGSFKRGNNILSITYEGRGLCECSRFVSQTPHCQNRYGYWRSVHNYENSLPVWQQSELHLEDSFVEIHVKNKTSDHMPIVGLSYSF